MSQYPNAGLFPRGRETLVSHIESGPGVAGGALQIGGGRGIAHKWLWRRCTGEPMRDEVARPRQLARLTPPETEEGVVPARCELLPDERGWAMVPALRPRILAQ